MKTLSKVYLLLFSAILKCMTVNAQLQSGPMVGYAEMREVALWVQTTEAASVKFSYTSPEGITHWTQEKTSRREDAFTVTLLADDVKPGTTYTYKVFVNGKEMPRNYPLTFKTLPLWQWRTDPPDFTFLSGSCFYVNEPEADRPGDPYGRDYQILDAMNKVPADFMIWLGDNTYLREPDWNTLTGIQHRYTHTRAFPGLQPLLGKMSHYAIWDDHDFGPNDSDGSFYHKDKTLDAFKDFWPNPGYGLPECGGMTSFFQWGDCDFFLLDNRWHRSANDLKTDTGGTILGECQKEWLIAALKSSKAAFKFVCMGGQLLNPAEVYENYAHLQPQERSQILRMLDEEKIENVVLLTGDRHHTALAEYKGENGTTVRELTVSPLTSKAYEGLKEGNTLMVEGTHVVESNFAEIRVSGPRNGRILNILIRDASGKKIWEKNMPQK